MNRFIALAGAAALALAFSLAASTPSSADPGGDAATAAFAGGLFGFAAGAAIGSGDEQYRPHHHHYNGDWEQHIQDCEDAYGWRYDADTDLVTRHHQQFYCDL